MESAQRNDVRAQILQAIKEAHSKHQEQIQRIRQQTPSPPLIDVGRNIIGHGSHSPPFHNKSNTLNHSKLPDHLNLSPTRFRVDPTSLSTFSRQHARRNQTNTQSYGRAMIIEDHLEKPDELPLLNDYITNKGDQ